MVKIFKELSSQSSAGFIVITDSLVTTRASSGTHLRLYSVHPIHNSHCNDDIEFKLDRMSARLAFVEARDRRAAAQAAHCAAGVKKSKKHCALVMILRIMARKRSKPTNRKHLNGTRDGGITMGNYMRSYNDRELQIFDEEQRVDAWIANLIGELSPAYEESPPPYSP